MKARFLKDDIDELQGIIDFAEGMRCADGQSVVKHPFNDQAMRLLHRVRADLKQDLVNRNIFWV